MKKLVAMLLSLSMIACLFAGCGGGNNSTNSGDDNSAKGNTLTVSLPSSPSKLDPIHYTGSYEGQIIQQVCSRMIEYNNDMTEYVPSLATSWTISDDGLNYVFQIRQGVHFQNGKFRAAN